MDCSLTAQLEILYPNERIVGNSKNEEGGTLRLFPSFHLSLIAFPIVIHMTWQKRQKEPGRVRKASENEDSVWLD